MRLGTILYPDFEMLDVYGPLEMFGSLGDDLRITTVAEQEGPIRAYSGPATLAEWSFENAPELDLILVLGGIGTLPELDNQAMIAFLQSRCPTTQITMSVCSGSALLARAGLLDGLSATSNKMFFDLAKNQSDAVDWITTARWVDAGQYVTSSGVSAGTDMALAIIERLFGAARADRVARYTEYQWHREAEDDPFHQQLNQAELPN